MIFIIRLTRFLSISEPLSYSSRRTDLFDGFSIDTSESGVTTEFGVVGNVYVFPDAESALVLPESVSNKFKWND